MNPTRPLEWLVALAAGAALMYFLDPVSGRRRRREIGGYAESTAKDLRSRATGMVAEARGAIERRLGERRHLAAVDFDLTRDLNRDLDR